MDPVPNDPPDNEETPPVLSGAAFKVIRYRWFSILWCFPSAGALYLLANDWTQWHWGHGVLEGLRSLRLEDWVATVLLGLHAFWIFAWRRQRRYLLAQ